MQQQHSMQDVAEEDLHNNNKEDDIAMSLTDADNQLKTTSARVSTLAQRYVSQNIDTNHKSLRFAADNKERNR